MNIPVVRKKYSGPEEIISGVGQLIDMTEDLVRHPEKYRWLAERGFSLSPDVIKKHSKDKATGGGQKGYYHRISMK